jgi:hypothetical protein
MGRSESCPPGVIAAIYDIARYAWYIERCVGDATVERLFGPFQERDDPLLLALLKELYATS